MLADRVSADGNRAADGVRAIDGSDASTGR